MRNTYVGVGCPSSELKYYVTGKNSASGLVDAFKARNNVELVAVSGVSGLWPADLKYLYYNDTIAIHSKQPWDLPLFQCSDRLLQEAKSLVSGKSQVEVMRKTLVDSIPHRRSHSLTSVKERQRNGFPIHHLSNNSIWGKSRVWWFPSVKLGTQVSSDSSQVACIYRSYAPQYQHSRRHIHLLVL